jgi:hypothetical protein
MKKLLSLTLFTLFGLLLAKEYRPLVQLDNQWIDSFFMYDMELGQRDYHDFHYRFSENAPQIINGKEYFEIESRWRLRFENTPITAWTDWELSFFYLSEDVENKKIYVYYPDNSQHSQGEFLLYDFNLEMGDLLDFTGFVEGEFSESLPILDITYENVFGLENVKTYHFQAEGHIPFMIYEGIGSTMGLVHASFMFDAGWELTAFGSNLYVSEFNSPKTKIYPNPFTNQIQIDTEKQIKQLQIFDLTGNLIQTKSNLDELNAQLSGLKSGVYILTISYENNSKDTFKIMKK